jgi:hypothetical protein
MNYKIKVGIEEFSVDEKDIPRIAEAMQTNNMVQLECGLFRGSAILAVCKDDKYKDIAFLTPSTPEQIAERSRLEEIDNLIKKQILECKICNGKGWKMIKKEGEYFATNCDCTKLREQKQPEIKKISSELANKFKI